MKSIQDDDVSRPQQNSNLNLLNLLALSRPNGATDPRDKVYALLAIVQDDIAKSIKPDYSIENTVAKGYIEVAEKYIKHGRGPKLLHHAGGNHLVADLPSWVPDWSLQTRSVFRKSLYKCSGYSQPHISLGPDPGKIQIRGAIVDSIANVGFPCRYYTHEFSQDKLLRMLEDQSDSLPAVNTDHHMRQVVYATGKMFCENLCSSSRYAEPMSLVLGRTLAADCTRSGKRSDQAFLESWAAYQEFNENSLQMPELRKEIELGSDEDRLTGKAWPYEAAMQEVQKGRRICATAAGYFGIATCDTEKEDLVAVFEGFSMPFVLRRKGQEFMLIGECYIHGIMDVELMCADVDQLDGSQTGEDKNGDRFGIRKPEGEFAVLEGLLLV